MFTNEAQLLLYSQLIKPVLSIILYIRIQGCLAVIGLYRNLYIYMRVTHA